MRTAHYILGLTLGLASAVQGAAGLRADDHSSCAEELVAGVIARRFPGFQPYSAIWDPTVITEPSALVMALRKAGIEEPYRKAIRSILYQLLERDLDNDPTLRDPMQVLRHDALRRGLLLCIVGGQCRGRHDGLYVSPQSKFEVASIRYPEFAESENRDYRIPMDPSYDHYPPVLFASVLSLRPDSNPDRIRTRALRWVGMLFHELKHHSNRELLRNWIIANVWLRNQGKVPDPLFLAYVDASGAVPRVDRAFVTIFEESTADNAAFRVVSLSSFSDDPELQAEGARAQARHARYKVNLIRRGAYGPSASRAVREGLYLADHFGKITEQNFLLVGSIMQQQMQDTVERYESASGLHFSPADQEEAPSYNITEHGRGRPDADRPNGVE